MHDHHGMSLSEQHTIAFLLDHACTRCSNMVLSARAATQANTKLHTQIIS